MVLGKRIRPSLAAAGLVLLGLTGTARADDAAAAEALFLEAKELMKSGRFDEACPKLEASYKLDKAVGTLMNVADCREKHGKIATAWAQWGAAHEWLKREGDKRAAFAAERQAALAPRLPRLRIDVKEERPGIDVFSGKNKLDTIAYNVALPVDPGEQIVSVRRGDQVLKEERVDAAEGATASVSLDLAAIERAAPPPPKPPPGPAIAPVGPPPPPPSSQKAIGFVVGGIGALGIVVAGVLEIVAISAVSKANEPDGCVNDFCSPTGLDSVDRARTFADVGQWVGIGSIVVAGIGVTLILTAPSAPPAAATGGRRAAPAARAWLAPWVGPSSSGVALKGTL